MRLIKPEIKTPEAVITESNAMMTKKIEEIKTLGGVVITKIKSDGAGEDIEFTAGNGESDDIFSFYNPLATQQIANDVFSLLSNYDYTPCEITNAFINPALELGDTVKVRVKLTQIWNWSFTTNLVITFSAPSNFDKYNKDEFKGTLTSEVDRLKRGTLNVIHNVVENDVLVSDTAMLMNAWIRYMIVEYPETNFEALDTRLSPPENNERNFIRAREQNIRLTNSVLSEEEHSLKISIHLVVGTWIIRMKIAFTGYEIIFGTLPRTPFKSSKTFDTGS